MKYIDMLKKSKNTHPDELQKEQKDLSTVFAAPEGTCISKKKNPQVSTPDPVPRPPGSDWYDDMICMVLDDLNDAGIEVTNFPEELRRKARQFFDEFSKAAAERDEARFWRALREWQRTWKNSLH